MHTDKNHDGMAVFVVSEMHKRHDEDGNEIPGKPMPNVEIVHVNEIANYYGLDPRDVWPLVHGNVMGQRVAYNTEDMVDDDRSVREWKVLKNGAGQPTDTKEVIKSVKYKLETDDGMYAKLSDVLRYARIEGWTKGGGLPTTTKQVEASASATDAKIDKLTDAITVLAQVVAGQVTAEKPGKR